MHLDYLDKEEQKRMRFETWYKLIADSILLDNAADVIRRRAPSGSVYVTQALPVLEEAAGLLREEAKQYA